MKTIQFAFTCPASLSSGDVGMAVPFDSAEGAIGVATLVSIG
jgi:hypothetical protein